MSFGPRIELIATVLDLRSYAGVESMRDQIV